MIEIGRAIVSRDILEEHFLCDLEKCRGGCCIEGDSGAPLTPGEASQLEEAREVLKEYLPEEHRRAITRQGCSIIDRDGDLVTPLVEGRQCVYSFLDENEILKCAVEKAWEEGRIPFRKPLSCHLFPVRITAYKRFDAVNYQKIDLCRPARECGLAARVPLYRFLREPLIRKYGEAWFEELELAARLLAETP